MEKITQSIESKEVNTYTISLNEFVKDIPSEEYFGYYNPDNEILFLKKEMRFPEKPTDGNWYSFHNHPAGISGHPSEVDIINMIEMGNEGPDYSLGNDGLYSFTIKDMNQAKEGWEKIKQDYKISDFQDLIRKHNLSNDTSLSFEIINKYINTTIEKKIIN